jgi:WD40 repeat protein
LVVEQAIGELASDDFSRRETATDAILKVGPPASAMLEAFKSNDAEQNYRIGVILPLLRERRATARGMLRGHSRPILGLTMSPDGKYLASSSGQTVNRPSAESEVWLWDVAKGKVARQMSDVGGPVRSIAWSSCGKWIGGALQGSDAHLWDAASGEIYRRLRTDGLASRSFAFVSSADPAGSPERAVVGMENGTVVLFDLKSGREIRRWAALADSVPVDVWVSPDGQTVYAATILAPTQIVQKQLEEIQIEQNESRKKSPRVDFPVTMIVSGGDELGVLNLSGNYVGLPYASQSAKRQLNFTISGSSTAMARSVVNKRIAIARQMAWSVFDAENGRLIQNGGGHQTMIESIAFDPVGETIYTGSLDGRIMIWPVNNW